MWAAVCPAYRHFGSASSEISGCDQSFLNVDVTVTLLTVACIEQSTCRQGKVEGDGADWYGMAAGFSVGKFEV